jgi:hypothetical protein
MLRAPDMMLEDTTSAKKYIGDVGGIMVKNILQFIFFQATRDVRGYWEAQHEGCWGDIGKAQIFQ